MFVCLECGRKFKSAKAAERAVDEGCPNCGGSDIDLDVPSKSPEPAKKIKLVMCDRYKNFVAGDRVEINAKDANYLLNAGYAVPASYDPY